MMILFWCGKSTRGKQIKCRSNNSQSSCHYRFSTNCFRRTSVIRWPLQKSTSWNCFIRSRTSFQGYHQKEPDFGQEQLTHRLASSIASGMRKRAATKDDFPALGRPATLIFSPPLRTPRIVCQRCVLECDSLFLSFFLLCSLRMLDRTSNSREFHDRFDSDWL